MLDNLFGSGTDEEGATEDFPGQGIDRVALWVDSERRKDELLGILRREAIETVDACLLEGRLRRIEVNVR